MSCSDEVFICIFRCFVFFLAFCLPQGDFRGEARPAWPVGLYFSRGIGKCSLHRWLLWRGFQFLWILLRKVPQTRRWRTKTDKINRQPTLVTPTFLFKYLRYSLIYSFVAFRRHTGKRQKCAISSRAQRVADETVREINYRWRLAHYSFCYHNLSNKARLKINFSHPVHLSSRLRVCFRLIESLSFRLFISFSFPPVAPDNFKRWSGKCQL